MLRFNFGSSNFERAGLFLSLYIVNGERDWLFDDSSLSYLTLDEFSQDNLRISLSAVFMNKLLELLKVFS